jgi:hypothetical protein
MGEQLNETLTTAMVKLAAAQVQMATDISKIASQMERMNGSIRDHTTRLALGSQWVENHCGPNSRHANIDKRLNVMWKLLWVAIALPTIIVVGGSVAAIINVLP